MSERSFGALMRQLEAAEHRCETCRNYAWHGTSMWPVVDAQGVTHHPGCAALRGLPRDTAEQLSLDGRRCVGFGLQASDPTDPSGVYAQAGAKAVWALALLAVGGLAWSTLRGRP